MMKMLVEGIMNAELPWGTHPYRCVYRNRSRDHKSSGNAVRSVMYLPVQLKRRYHGRWAVRFSC